MQLPAASASATARNRRRLVAVLAAATVATGAAATAATALGSNGGDSATANVASASAGARHVHTVQATVAKGAAENQKVRNASYTVKPASYGSSPQAIARQIVPADQYQAFANIIQKESGWNVHAVNPSSGAYGLGQALPGAKMATAGSAWRDDAATQIKWALNYMNERYGSPQAAWAHELTSGWY